MSDLIFTIAQIVYILWPLFIITALFYSFQGHLRWRSLVRRVQQNLLITWTILFVDWFITLFARLPTPTLFPEPWYTIIFLGGFALLLLGEVGRLGLLPRRLRARVDLRRTRSLQSLKEMDPYAFENLVGETYRALGFQAKHVGHSGDHGVDIQLTAPDGKHWIVQCKRYHGTVGESIVRDLYGTLISERAARAVLVTTANISPPAETWARGKPLELIDGPALLKMIEEAHRRTAGSLLTRLAGWLEGLIAPAVLQGLQPGLKSTTTLGATQPVGVRPGGNGSRPGISPTGALPHPGTVELAPITQRPVAHGHTGAPAPVDGPAPAAGPAITQPISIRPTPPQPAGPLTLRYLRGAPICPNCGLPMVPRPPRPTDRLDRVLYRCRNYPACRVTLEREVGGNE